MDTKTAITSQFQASLDMLQQAIELCPEALWDAPKPPNRFWQLAYHSLFFTHLYLAPRLAEFEPWEKHQSGLEEMGHRSSQAPDGVELVALSKPDLLAYVRYVRGQLERSVSGQDLSAESGFHWLPCSKLELHIYNIRHLQSHVGELSERLGTRAEMDVNWISRGRG